MQVALALQFPLDLAQRFHIIHSLAAESAADGFLVDVVKPGAGIILAQRVLKIGQVGKLGQCLGRVAQTERLPAGHARLRPARVHVRPPGPERIGELAHLGGEAGVLQGLGHQPGQLLALRVGERVQQSLRCRHPPDQRIDEFLKIGRGVREHVAVAGHEVIEVLLGVLAAGIGIEHGVQRGHHVLDPLHGLGIGLGEGLPHAAELAVQHLTAQQRLELLESLPGRRGPPVVVG